MISPTLIWNIRGIGNAKSLRSIKSHIRRYDIQVVCIIEPKLPVDRLDSVRQRLKVDYACANQDDNPKIWVFWQNSIAVSIVQRNA